MVRIALPLPSATMAPPTRTPLAENWHFRKSTPSTPASPCDTLRAVKIHGGEGVEALEDELVFAGTEETPELAARKRRHW